MSRVLVLGATGIIGFSAARWFALHGWTVYGLSRTEEKARNLKKNLRSAL